MTYANVLEALADPRRRQILQALKFSPMPVNELARLHPVSRPAISQHLKVLVAANLVGAEKKGTQRIYHIRREGLDQLRQWLDDFWTDALAAYAEEVERREGGNG